MIFCNAELIVTEFGMVVCQGQSEVLSNQNITVSAISFEEIILWQPDLI